MVELTPEQLQSLVDRLHALADKQRRERGDILYRGQHDPELTEAADAISQLLKQQDALREALEACDEYFKVDEECGDGRHAMRDIIANALATQPKQPNRRGEG